MVVRLKLLSRTAGEGGPSPKGLVGEGRLINHLRSYRNFSVARPAIARIQEMIQNRMTIVGSSQPFCSK